MSALRKSLALLTGRQKLFVGALAIATLVLNLLDLLAIALLGAVGALTVGDEGNFVSQWLPSSDTNSLVVVLLAVTGGVFLVKSVVGIVLARIRQFFLAGLEIYFSDAIAQHLFSGTVSDLKLTSRPKIEWSILRSTEIAFGSVLGLSLQIFADLTLSLLILGLFFYTDWISALVVMAYFTIVLGLLQWSTKGKVGKTGTQVSEGSISVGEAIGDMLSGFREIAVLSKIPNFLAVISAARTKVAHARARYSYMSAVPRLVAELSMIVGAIGFTAYQFGTTGGNPDLALISIFLIGSLRIMSALLPLYRSLLQLRHDGPLAKESQHLVREAIVSAEQRASSIEVSISNREGLGKVPSTGLSVEVRTVSFSYRDPQGEETALEEISMSVKPGSRVAIIGPSGSGKSTLADLMLGLQSPSSGHIACSGVPPVALRKQSPGLLGYVPQKPGLLSGSVRENIALGVPENEVDEEALWEAIELSQIGEFIGSLAGGVDSFLGEQNDSLSGGQLQRIGLARALYTRPKLLVLDEATSGLDAETEAGFGDALSSLGNSITAITIAHRLHTIQNADEVFVLAGGRIIGAGKLPELAQTLPLVRKYIDLMTVRSGST